jgi:hypothetical protein
MSAPHGVTCPICRAATGQFLDAREMMFGTRESFTYFECEGCGCLHLIDVPADLAAYYPKEYYSLKPLSPRPVRSYLRQRLAASRNSGSMFGHTPLTWMLDKHSTSGWRRQPPGQDSRRRLRCRNPAERNG